VITASQVERLIACPGSAALPQARTVTVWSDAGEERHEWLARVVETGDAGEAPEHWREQAEEIVATLLPHLADGIEAESPLAYDVATGEARRLPRGAHRDYRELGPFEIAMTVDVLVAGGRPVVWDFKGFLDVAPAERNWQLRVAALAVARLVGATEVDVAICYVREGQRLRWDRAVVDYIDLEEAARRLRALHGAVAEQVAQVAARRLPTVSQGPHCRFCPSHASCPASTALIRRLTSGAEVDELGLLRPLDDATARAAYERLQAAKQMLKRIEGALYAHAAERPIPLGEGRFFGKHDTPGREEIDGDIAWRVVSELHGRDLADAAVERSASKASIKRALQGAKVTPVAAAEREILRLVRAAGGAQRRESERVEEFTLRPALVAGEETA
jgi:hypothetical protein